jgi:hypothetical protein
MDMDTIWQEAVDAVEPWVVKISTTQGTGTGFLVYRSSAHPVCGIATAAHVIDHAHYWEQPIRIEHPKSGTTVLLHLDERSVYLDEDKDTAVIIMSGNELPLPKQPPVLWRESGHLKIGNEVGWLGFPAVASRHLCFFSGRVSCYIRDEKSYLIDGVAINGVSGGPTFFPFSTGGVCAIVGIVSAYIPNRATGNILPGVSLVRDVSPFLELITRFKSVEEAKHAEPPSAEPPPAPDTKPLQ